MKTKEQIIEWLKSNALYDAFAKNISPITVEEVVEKYCSRIPDIGIIDFALNWVSTNEGFSFWDNANSEFRQWFNSDDQTEQSSGDEQTSEDEQFKQSSSSVQSSDRWIFDRGSKEAPFYMVYAEGQSAPTFKHGSMEEATKKADRLAKLLNTKTYVLAAVMEIRPKIVTSAVGIDDMEHQEDNPF